MVIRRRFAVAHAALAVAGVVIAIGTVWYFAGTSRQIAPAAAVKPKTTGSQARLAADAMVGAVKAADPDGVCALLASVVRGQHPDCRSWAEGFIGLTQGSRYAVKDAALESPKRARVGVLVDGQKFSWFFVHERGAWRFESAAPEPSA